MLPITPATIRTNMNYSGMTTELYLDVAATQFSATFTPNGADNKSTSLSQAQNTQGDPSAITG